MIWIAKNGSPAIISAQVKNNAVAWFLLYHRYADGTLTPIGQRIDPSDLPDGDAVFLIPPDEHNVVYELRILPAAQHDQDIPLSISVQQSKKILRAYDYSMKPINGTKAPYKPVRLDPLKSGVAKTVSFDIWFE